MDFAISIISAMGVIRRFPQLVINRALDWGYNGVQMLPIRQATGKEDPVLLFEGPWNAVSGFWHAARHLPGSSGEPSTPLDWYFFPPEEECKEITVRLRSRGIPEIGHHFGKTRLVELKPGIGTVDEIIDQCRQTETKLVFDPRHFCRPARDGLEAEANGGKESPFGKHLGQQLESLEALAPLISVIHYQPVDGENIPDLLAETPNNTTRTLIRNCLQQTNIQIMVAEYRPPLNPLAVADTARRILEAMRRLAA